MRVSVWSYGNEMPWKNPYPQRAYIHFMNACASDFHIQDFWKRTKKYSYNTTAVLPPNELNIRLPLHKQCLAVPPPFLLLNSKSHCTSYHLQVTCSVTSCLPNLMSEFSPSQYSP